MPLDPRQIAGLLTPNADTPRLLDARERSFDVEDFRRGPGGADRSDFAAMRAMIDRAMTLATGAEPIYSAMRWSGDLDIGGGHLFPDGFPTGCALQGYGRRRSRLLVTADDAIGLGNVINTRGGNQIDVGNFAIVYDDAATTPQDFAVVVDAGAEQVVEKIAVTAGYGQVLVGRTGAASRCSIRRVYGAQFRGALGGDHVRVQWCSSLEMERLRCNTTQTMTGAFYRFAPLAGMLVDTFVMERCQGQNANHSGLTTGDGMVFDCTFGNIYSGTTISCIVDHTFGKGVAYISRPYAVGGVPQKTSIRNLQHFHLRNTADDGASRYFDHKGAGRMSQIGETGGYIQISLGAAVQILTRAGYFEAPNFNGCEVRSTASIQGGESIPNVFDVAEDLRFQNGRIGKLGESDITMPKLGRVTNGATLQFTGNWLDNIVDPTFDMAAANAGSIVRDNIGTAQVLP